MFILNKNINDDDDGTDISNDWDYYDDNDWDDHDVDVKADYENHIHCTYVTCLYLWKKIETKFETFLFIVILLFILLWWCDWFMSS